MNLPASSFAALLPLNDGDHLCGSATAAIILIEYGDYQCVHSKQAHRSIQSLLPQLEDRLCIVFRHFPQPQLHPRSLRAAESAEAAAAQGKFWQMHEQLFAHQQQLEDSDLVQYADCLGLEIPPFLRGMAEHLHLGRIQADIESGKRNGVEKTPTFFVGVRCEETQNLEVLLSSLLEINKRQ
ncbi:MAG: hypothetical protein N4J56_006628 [Chroococcidiopsis sp. SAG 2025]|uniref:DsbA family protein n=1 Tax=Chroococcidiopsis sp. SAG 2025 TaxID=171389 RepID=UPI002936DDF4|nr:thioredoxin domain-containing protein [Chroococcidiopsis sp. SAG 2025]MDV2996923.1 hypothetical protein [Chroococcidiopsis sp. SAG 2025]